MNSLKVKIKHDLSHERIAILVRSFFGVRTTENREIMEIKEELKDLSGLKAENSLYNQPFVCLNPQNNQFKKKT